MNHLFRAFSSNGQHKEAINFIYTNKTGIKVLGIETEDEMMALIEKAKYHLLIRLL